MFERVNTVEKFDCMYEEIKKVIIIRPNSICLSGP